MPRNSRKRKLKSYQSGYGQYFNSNNQQYQEYPDYYYHNNFNYPATSYEYQTPSYEQYGYVNSYYNKNNSYNIKTNDAPEVTHNSYNNKNNVPPEVTPVQYINGKRVISKASLYKSSDTGNFENNTNNDVKPFDWTEQYWQRRNDSEDYNNKPTTTARSQSKNQNKLEKKLNEMLAKPVEMSKGKSLLEKMGWQGGGLGKSGDGIVEPIAPKATYAVKTIGLGHGKEKKRPQVSRKNKHTTADDVEFPDNYRTNILITILDFVKNEREIEIVFDNKLSNSQRLRIHQIVGGIRKLDSEDDIDDSKYSDVQIRIIEEILEHNSYVLYSESEGDRKKRQLIVYKEAPIHMFLITPDDLKEEEKPEKKVKKKTKKAAAKKSTEESSIAENEQNPPDNIDNEENTIIISEDEQNSPENKTNEEIALIIDKEDNISASIPKDDIEDNSKKSLTDNSTDETKALETEQKTIVNTIDVKDNLINEKPVLEADNSSTTKSEKNVIKNQKENPTISTITSKHDIEKSEKDVIENQNENTVITDKEATEIEIDTQSEITKNNENEILIKLVDYFKEFVDETVYTEFRFLGAFSNTELSVISRFVDICVNREKSDCEKTNELIDILNGTTYEYTVEQDINGSNIIYKTKKNGTITSVT